MVRLLWQIQAWMVESFLLFYCCYQELVCIKLIRFIWGTVQLCVQLYNMLYLLKALQMQKEVF